MITLKKLEYTGESFGTIKATYEISQQLPFPDEGFSTTADLMVKIEGSRYSATIDIGEMKHKPNLDTILDRYALWMENLAKAIRNRKKKGIPSLPLFCDR